MALSLVRECRQRRASRTANVRCKHVRRFAERELVALSLRDRCRDQERTLICRFAPNNNGRVTVLTLPVAERQGYLGAIRIDKPGLERIRWCVRLGG